MHMSYGNVASKTGHLMVETTTGAGGAASDVALDRFQTTWGATWVAGRLTLTRLHLTFVPNRVGRGAGILTLDTVDLSGVEVVGGVVSRSLRMRTSGHVVQVRCLGAPALAEQVAEVVEAARRARRT